MGKRMMATLSSHYNKVYTDHFVNFLQYTTENVTSYASGIEVL